VLSGDVAERAQVVLAHPLRAPEEARVAEELAVRGLVLVGVAVPVRAVRRQGVVLIDGPALGADRPVFGHHATMIAPPNRARDVAVGWTPVGGTPYPVRCARSLPESQT
jgi:hypothetical protein